MSPTLKAFAVLILAFIGGVILYQAGHWVIGMAVVLAAVPIALVTWITANDRV
jgi:hypothetical protein